MLGVNPSFASLLLSSWNTNCPGLSSLELVIFFVPGILLKYCSKSLETFARTVWSTPSLAIIFTPTSQPPHQS